MSFHFQAQGDSSDEEQVDLTSWQSTAKSAGQQRAPVARVQAQTDEEIIDGQVMAELDAAIPPTASGALQVDSNDEGDDAQDGGEDEQSEDNDIVELKVDSASESQDTRNRRSNTHWSLMQSGFTSVNQPVSGVSSDESDRTMRKNGASVSKKQRKLVPAIPRSQLDPEEREEFQDFTAGGDVVRKVLKELKDGRRDIVYKVEFEDLHVEEVRYAFACSVLAVPSSCVGPHGYGFRGSAGHCVACFASLDPLPCLHMTGYCLIRKGHTTHHMLSIMASPCHHNPNGLL
jgi:hypothetical protein